MTIHDELTIEGNAPLSFYIETYGCQMNVSDSEIVTSVLKKSGYRKSTDIHEADIVLLNTCSVRENAETKIHERLIHFKNLKVKRKNLVVGILGCMAERLRKKLIEEEKLVNLVVGPDEYRNLGGLIESTFEEENVIAVRLSRVETYEDIEPDREDNVLAWL